MDTVELARKRAAQLHAELVGLGHDPWRPFDFAMAEVRRRDYDAEPARAGAGLLDRGRATLIAKDRLILFEETASLFERAFLVAHELGHLELGDDPDDHATPDIDPSRAAEASPMGLDRVVDYGRRQRREVQMDLFAREFLLPRDVARVLHVDDGLSASDIAARLSAPFDVVAQQLLDALLLPAIEDEAASAAPHRPLNTLQSEAARHRGAPYLLEAGPGTGKTQTLTARVESLLDDAVDPRRILVLTFSNKAAGEMATRIALKRPEAAAAMWIGTFHAFGLDIIRRFHAELGLPKDPRLMDRTEAVELLEEEFPRLGLQYYRNIYDPTQKIADMLAAISRAKDEVVDAQRYGELVDAMASRPEQSEAAARAAEVAKVYSVYEAIKLAADCVDFGDLVMLPVKLLEARADIRAHMHDLYDHVLVDEYQDVNRSSVRLLQALRGDGHNLWVVGDAKQSIYRFRGASSFNMRRFGSDDFSGGERGRLKTNYRSVSEIVDAYSTFAATMRAASGDSALDAERGPGGSHPEVRTVERATEQTAAMADAIEQAHQNGVRYRDQAVLCTGNEKLSTIAHEFERLGIPVLFLGSLFERAEVKDLLAMLSILTDRRAMGLVRVATWPEFEMPINNVAAVFDHLRAADMAPGTWLAGSDDIPGLSEPARAALGKLRAALAGFDQTSQPWTVLASLLLDRTRLAGQIGSAASVAERTRGIAIWQLMNFLRAQPKAQGLPIVRLLHRIRRLVRLAEERDLRQLPAAAQGIDAVRLMTIHGAKGLEFPIVHIPGVNKDTIPRTPPGPACPPPAGMIEGDAGDPLDLLRADQEEEQECLFYVALSRARDRLLLYAPSQNKAGSSRPLSPFVGKLGPNVAVRNVKPGRVLPPLAEDADVPLEVTGRLRFDASQISLYESCPRRFFYTHVLQIGGRRVTSGFTLMHDAVRTVFRAVVSGAAEITSDAALLDRIERAFEETGVSSLGYVAEYRQLATTMLSYFLEIRAGHRPELPEALSLSFGAEEIIVMPDDLLVGPDGGRIVRKVQTGHQRSAELDDVGAAAFLLAARTAFPGAVVELVHLSDGTRTPLDRNLTPKKIANRQDKLSAFLADIRQGRFRAEISSFTCPNCPAFFVCGPTPLGKLKRKFV